MQFVTRYVAKVELDSTSATVARNIAIKVAPRVWALMSTDSGDFIPSFKKLYHTLGRLFHKVSKRVEVS